MALQVTTNDTTKVYADAIKWHIDDAGNLHVIAAGHKHLAAYKHSEWSNVNLMLTENQAEAEDIILNEIHDAMDTAGIDDEEHPDFALSLLGKVLSKLIESGHIHND